MKHASQEGPDGLHLSHVADQAQAAIIALIERHKRLQGIPAETPLTESWRLMCCEAPKDQDEGSQS